MCWRSTGRERGPWRWSGDVLGSGVNICRFFVARVCSFVLDSLVLISRQRSEKVQNCTVAKNPFKGVD